MKRKADYTMRDWRDYYERLAKRAEDNYQQSGITRYENEQMKYEAIVDAFNGYLEHKDEANTEKVRRQHNIDAYADRMLNKSDYSLDEVKRIISTIRDF